MNLTSRFLLQSDKLAIGPHLLLAPACKPAEHEIAHRQSPTQEGGVAMLTAEWKVEAVLGLWKNNGLTRKSSCSARS